MIKKSLSKFFSQKEKIMISSKNITKKIHNCRQDLKTSDIFKLVKYKINGVTVLKNKNPKQKTKVNALKSDGILRPVRMQSEMIDSVLI